MKQSTARDCSPAASFDLSYFYFDLRKKRLTPYFTDKFNIANAATKTAATAICTPILYLLSPWRSSLRLPSLPYKAASHTARFAAAILTDIPLTL